MNDPMRIAPLKISVLGGLTISQNGEFVSGFGWRKAEALLVYLICNPQAHSRQALASLLWEEETEEKALYSLRMVLNRLRQKLDIYLVSDRQQVAFNRQLPFLLDLAEMETLFGVKRRINEIEKKGPGLKERERDRQEENNLKEKLAPEEVEHLERGLELYRGEFLKGFYLKENASAEFEQWVLSEQERIQKLVLDVCRRLVAHRLNQQQWEKGIRTAQRWLQLDPLSEEAYRALMRLLAFSGQRSAALAQYENCQQALAQELGLEPEPATTNLYRQIRQGNLEKPFQEPLRVSNPLVLPASTKINNLPAQLNSLVGRENELGVISRLLRREEPRLLTIIGPGGVGKTRLALQAALDCLEYFEDGVFLVELSTVTDPGEVLNAIYTQLTTSDYFKPAGEQPPLEILKNWLDRKKILLVLDNFEQVQSAGNHLNELLKAAAGLKLIITSREALQVYGEYRFILAPLPLPDLENLPSPAFLSHQGATQLFLQRARAVKQDFSLTLQNSPAVAEICNRLDGLPLAVELAAARVKMLPPEQLLKRLDHRLTLLTGGGKDIEVRQQTLKGAIDWSYDLLSPPERVLFARLAIFRGGWFLEAAEEVCAGPFLNTTKLAGAPRIESTEVLDILNQLVQKSLIVISEEEHDKMPRYRMLESIREYALLKFQELGETEETTNNFLNFSLKQAAELNSQIKSPFQTKWLDRLELEYPNLQEALDKCLNLAYPSSLPEIKADFVLTGLNKLEIGKQLAEALQWFWFTSSLLKEGRTWLDLELNEGPRTGTFGIKSRVKRKGTGQKPEDVYRTIEIGEEAVLAARNKGDKLGLAHSTAFLASALSQLDDQRASEYFIEAGELFNELQEFWWAGLVSLNQGLVSQDRKDYPAARRLITEAREIFKREETKSWEILALQALGRLKFLENDQEQGGNLLEESLRLARQQEDKKLSGWSLVKLGFLALSQDKYREATRFFNEGLVFHQQIGDKAGVANCLEGLSRVAPGEEYDGALESINHPGGIYESLLKEEEVATFPTPPARRKNRNIASLGRLARVNTAVIGALALFLAAGLVFNFVLPGFTGGGNNLAGTAANTSSNIVLINGPGFEQQVLEASKNVPVLLLDNENCFSGYTNCEETWQTLAQLAQDKKGKIMVAARPKLAPSGLDLLGKAGPQPKIEFYKNGHLVNLNPGIDPPYTEQGILRLIGDYLAS